MKPPYSLLGIGLKIGNVKKTLFFSCVITAMLFISTVTKAQASDTIPIVELKKLSLEELLDIEVISVSRHPQKLLVTSSAIQVITGQDIHRFGASRLPETLRLASNLQVAQTDQSQFAISARGFNATIANKMLVLIDGRAVYTPLFAGVFWDIQDVFMEDLDRIEVVSGPGGTLWGANAVNGVINVISKSAKETQGLLLQAGTGNQLQGYGSLRYGGAISPKLHYRIYGKASSRYGTVRSYSQVADKHWQVGQGGFRMGWELSEANNFTFQGDLYDNRVILADKDPFTRGGNLLGRWSHTFSENSDLKLQLYFDQVHRAVPGSYDDLLNTYDIDFQHNFIVGAKNKIVWGAGYRMADDNFGSDFLFEFDPKRFLLETYSMFIQDEIELMKDRLVLTIGTKLLHNSYTDFEFQPNIRTAWRLREQQTLWAAVSRAVRTPSRIDRDFVALPYLIGGPNFQSENLLAYELGYRLQSEERFYFSTALFFHDYDDLRSLEQVNPPAAFPIELANMQEGESYGAELVASRKLTDWIELRVGYTLLQLEIRPKSGSTSPATSTEAADAEHLFSLRTSMNLPKNLEFSMAYRYVSAIENPAREVPDYNEIDARLAWHPIPKLELSVIGQNILHDSHPEFGNPASQQEIERSVYGKILWQF